MLIDWFTVFAQVLNFLVLVWLMQRFLYKPILRAIDAREKRVADALAEADRKKAEAQTERDAFLRKNEDFERQRAELMGQMNDEVESERFRLLDEARQAAAALRDKRMEALRSDAQALGQDIRLRAQQEVFAIARKTLEDLAAASLEERMAELLVRRLRALDEKEKGELRRAFTGEGGPVLVRSAFALSEAQRGAIEGAVRDVSASGAAVCFEVAPDLVSGIELLANGRKVAWNISDYLLSLEKGLGELLDAHSRREVLIEPAPAEDGPGDATA